MNNLNKSFSIRRVGCLLSYSIKEWREWYLYLPLGCLIIGIAHIIYSIYIGNPKSIEFGDSSGFVNVSNYMDNAWGFFVVYILIIVFVISQLLSKVMNKGKSTFYRSMPTTALEKMISFFMELLIMIFLIVSMKVLSLILDGIVCTIYNYNEWTDILPAIKDYFTPELSISNGEINFGFAADSHKIVDESWLSNKLFIWGVSFNRKLSYIALFIMNGALICLNKQPIKKLCKIRKYRMSTGLRWIVMFLEVLLIFYLMSIWGMEFFEMIISMFVGCGPWCYNYEYGWMIQTFVLILWTSFWIFVMYVGIKRGEAR